MKDNVYVNKSRQSKIQVNAMYSKDADGRMVPATLLLTVRADSTYEAQYMLTDLKKQLGIEQAIETGVAHAEVREQERGGNEQHSTFTFASKKCPDCGNGHMILRMAKNGRSAGESFYGCSSYPRCRHSEKVEAKKKEYAYANEREDDIRDIPF